MSMCSVCMCVHECVCVYDYVFSMYEYVSMCVYECECVYENV
jgi:hypothetical protein